MSVSSEDSPLYGTNEVSSGYESLILKERENKSQNTNSQAYCTIFSLFIDCILIYMGLHLFLVNLNQNNEPVLILRSNLHKFARNVKIKTI